MRTRQRGTLLFLIITITLGSLRHVGADSPLDVGDRKQLFIDRRFIENSQNVELRMNPPQKLGLVIPNHTEPWSFDPSYAAHVMEDGGVFKMYYGCYTPAGRAFALSVSKDGLQWTHPDLGVVSIAGNKNNNVLFVGDGFEIASIFKDHRDIPERRYKVFRVKHVHDNRDVNGMYAYISADGVHFKEYGRVLPLFIDNPALPRWDARIGKYVVYTRSFIPGAENQRKVARLETDDLLKPWPYNKKSPIQDNLRALPEHLGVVLQADSKLDPYQDLYYNNAFIYPWAQDAYFMFITPFRHFHRNLQPWFRFEPGNDYGLIEPQLAVSRDGIHWSRPSREPYVRPGLPDEFDRWTAIMGAGMIRKGNYLYQYYNSSSRTHDSAILRPEYDDIVIPHRGIGAVRQRLDGFMSADANFEGGWFQTPLVVFRGNHLRLNIDTGATGTTFVEIRDKNDQPIPGFTLKDCEEVGGNFVRSLVRWNGKADLSQLVGKPVKLYFKMTGSKLYAFQFVKAN